MSLKRRKIILAVAPVGKPADVIRCIGMNVATPQEARILLHTKK